MKEKQKNNPRRISFSIPKTLDDVIEHMPRNTVQTKQR